MDYKSEIDDLKLKCNARNEKIEILWWKVAELKTFKDKFEGFEQYKSIAKMIEFHVSEKLKEIENLLRAITDGISEWVDDYTEFKSIVLNFLDNSASYHARQNNSEWALEIRKFIKRLKEIKTKKTKLKKKIEYPKWCKPNEYPGDVDCSECPHKSPDPIEIIVEHTHVIIKFENETRRYKYLEGRFTEPNQLLLILERDLETTASRTNNKNNKKEE